MLVTRLYVKKVRVHMGYHVKFGWHCYSVAYRALPELLHVNAYLWELSLLRSAF